MRFQQSSEVCGVGYGSDVLRSGRVISPDRAKFGVVPRSAGADIQNSASYKFCPTTHTCQVSSTSAQRSRGLRVLKILAPHGRSNGHVTDFMSFRER